MSLSISLRDRQPVNQWPDLLDRLRFIRDYKPGMALPQWYIEMGASRPDGAAWQALIAEAIGEIENLRTLQDGYSKLRREIYGS
jgi:hypothetical protein